MGQDKTVEVSPVVVEFWAEQRAGALARREGLPFVGDRMNASTFDLGARGVPFTVFGRSLAAPGALSVADYSQALDQADDALSAAAVTA